MRIMIAGSAYAPARNGQAVFTTNLAEGLVKHGHQVMVLVDSISGQASHSQVNGVEVVRLSSIGLDVLHSNVKFTPFPARQVKRMFDTFQPHVVHIQDHFPISRAAVREAHRRGIMVVGSNHFIPENVAPYMPVTSKIKPVVYWLLWWWMTDLFHRVDVISGQSRAAVSLMQEHGLDQPTMPVSCGLDLDEFSPKYDGDRIYYRRKYGIDPDKTAFLFVGRLDGEKRVDLLIKAMEQLPRHDIQMVIAGKGRSEDELNQMSSDLQKSGKIVFTGFVPSEDLPGLLNSVDIFVMPSEAELLSISTLEAMASGLPILLADALALPELVNEGQNGYLFKAGAADDLAEKMVKLANHPEKWKAMGMASRQIAQSHSLETTLNKFELVYKQLLRQKPVFEQKHGFRRTVSPRSR